MSNVEKFKAQIIELISSATEEQLKDVLSFMKEKIVEDEATATASLSSYISGIMNRRRSKANR